MFNNGDTMINIVLYNPEIPSNTGNIGRTCVGIDAKLHIIKPIGFEITDKSVKRAGLDYWSDLNYQIYENYEHFLQINKPAKNKIFYLTRYATKLYSEVDFKVEKNEEIYLVFGAESKGLPKNILVENRENCLRIPTTPNVRSLNLSNCVFLIAFEAAKQNDFEKLINYDVQKGANYLDK